MSKKRGIRKHLLFLNDYEEGLVPLFIKIFIYHEKVDASCNVRRLGLKAERGNKLENLAVRMERKREACLAGKEL